MIPPALMFDEVGGSGGTLFRTAKGLTSCGGVRGVSLDGSCERRPLNANSKRVRFSVDNEEVGVDVVVEGCKVVLSGEIDLDRSPDPEDLVAVVALAAVLGPDLRVGPIAAAGADFFLESPARVI